VIRGVNSNVKTAPAARYSRNRNDVSPWGLVSRGDGSAETKSGYEAGGDHFAAREGTHLLRQVNLSDCEAQLPGFTCLFYLLNFLIAMSNHSLSVVGAREAANILGCTPSYVRRLCRQGDLEAQKTGSAWIIPRSEVEEEKDCRRTVAAAA
jgi:excisionase family DNA binding protein